MAGVYLVLVIPGPLVDNTPVVYSPKQCLTANIYFESRGESKEAMKAVAFVTHNRNKKKDICQVVFQKKQFSWTWQLNWEEIHKIMIGDLSDLSYKDKVKYHEAVKIASIPSKSLGIKLPSETKWYHADYVKPSWSFKLRRVGKIGKHIFYKEHNSERK